MLRRQPTTTDGAAAGSTIFQRMSAGLSRIERPTSLSPDGTAITPPMAPISKGKAADAECHVSRHRPRLQQRVDIIVEHDRDALGRSYERCVAEFDGAAGLLD